MRIQVLAVTMNQNDHSLLQKLNIQTDALIGNQCNRNLIEMFEWNNNKITFYNFAEKGVGLNRNNLLMRADGDVCLFADDDMEYINGYSDIVERVFCDYPKADLIVFNLREDNEKKRYVIKKKTRVKWFNFMRYGAVRIAARRSKLAERGIYFNQCFGGGSMYRHGEDTLFLAECLKKGLKIIAVPIVIAHLNDDRPSTWNIGYDDKYFYDQGKLYSILSRRWFKFLCFQDAVRHSREYKRGWLSVYKLMIKGAKCD